MHAPSLGSVLHPPLHSSLLTEIQQSLQCRHPMPRIKQIDHHIHKQCRAYILSLFGLDESSCTWKSPDCIPKLPKCTQLDSIIAAVRDWVESIALTECLKKEDADLKAKYSDHFPSDIPYLDNLPTDVYHRIRLKDPNKIIA